MKSPQFSIRTTLLLIISILNILITILVGSDVYASWMKFEQERALTQVSATVNLFYKARKYLSLERGASLSVIYVSPDTAKSMQDDITLDRKGADLALDQGLAQIAAGKNNADVTPGLMEVEQQLRNLRDLRLELDVAMTQPLKKRNPKLPDRIFDASTALITKISGLAAAYIRPLQSVDATVSRQMMFKYAVWEITEYAGREYAVLGRLIAEEKPLTPEVQENLLTWRTLTDHGWETAHQLVDGSGVDNKLVPYIKEAQAHYFLTFGQIKDIFYAQPVASDHASYPLTTEMWLELSSDAVESLLSLKDASLTETQGYVANLQQQAEHEIFFNIFLFFCAVAASLYCLALIILRVIRPVNAMVDALYKTSHGAPHDPLPTLQRYDEIGKLASVLEVLEDNVRTIKQSNEELERYAYITAHDLKSPLRAIDNLAMWIEEGLGDALTGKTKEYMDLLRQRVRRMEKLLNDTLEYSRIGRQVQPANSETINGKALVEDAVSMAAPPLGFMVMVGEEFSRINLIRTPLQQVFYNLINNAVKHHDKGTGTITVDVKEEPSHYSFSVRDDGPGIPRQYHEKVFEMFQTLKPRDQREGSGMGLAIVRKILTTCGGTITLESEFGQGALFKFTWPKPGKEKKMLKSNTLENIHILLIEDDEIDVEAIRRAFKKHNIKNPLHHAVCGVEALEIMRGENQRQKLPHPFVLLVDLNMPKMNGLDFLKEVRSDENLKESIAFILTTSARDIDIAAAYELNAAGYFLKDNMHELIDMFAVYGQINKFPDAPYKAH